MTSILKTEIIFATPNEGKQLIEQHDSYTNILTKFDLQAKVKTTEEVNVLGYIENAKKYIYNWQYHEIEYLKKVIANTENKIKEINFNFELPDKIFLIKSAMHEEGNANGFTRSNFIVLNFNSLSLHLFEHELFHIISRYNADKIEKAYNILGFNKCNEVEIPKEIIDFKITNPDAPFNNYYISVKYCDANVEAIMLLYSKTHYSGGRFFKYVNKGLMLIEGETNNKKAILENGTPKIIDYKDATDLYDQIGKNTSYNIHQEEVSADHFIMALNRETNLPNQNLIIELTKVLQS
jgi:hypothetical protein